MPDLRQIRKIIKTWMVTRSGKLAIALMAALALTCCLLSVGPSFNFNAWVNRLSMPGPWSVGLFILAHVLATVVGVPGTVLVVAGGAAFGLVWGTVWSVLGATMGAIAAFGLARYLLRDWTMHRLQHHQALQWVEQMACQNPLTCVLAVRFAPISPFNLVNFLFGLTSINLKPYALGTFLGIMPGTLAYTWLGVTGQQALRGEALLPLVTASSLLLLLSAMPLLVKRWRSPRSSPRP